MKVVSVRALAVDVGFQRQSLQTDRIASPMGRWPEYAARRASWMWPSKKTFVRIEADDGAVGWSCTNGGEVTALIINEHLARLVEDRTVDDIGELWDQMAMSLLPVDRSGFAMMAVGAVDIALWDLKSRCENRSLLELLGGPRHTHLEGYVTTPSPEAWAGQRWHGLKAAMPFGDEGGAEGFAENVALIERFRAAAGPNQHVMLDAFMAWDADYTLRFAEAVSSSRLHWIEDPLPPGDLEGFRQIRQHGGSDIRLALGNFCYSRGDCRELLREGLVDVLQPDVAWAGGITEGLRIMELAAETGVDVILHNTAEQPWAMALAAARQPSPVVERVDRGVASTLYTLMGDQPRFVEGRLATAGLGAGNTPPAHVADLFDNELTWSEG